MKPTIFREYDIRGIVDQEFIIDQTYDLAQAIATYMHQKHPDPRPFVVGRDGRVHSLLIQQKIIAALIDMGFDVIDVGLCPTPSLYFAVHQLGTPKAMVVTASHNPKEYNGIKMWNIHGSQIQAIRHLFEEKKFFSPHSNKKGTIHFYNIINDYIDFLATQFSHLKNFPIHAIIDCAHGIAGTVMPGLIKKMNWPHIKLLFPEIDGNFPAHEADPTVMKNMTYVAQALQDSPELELGLGFDGDCDRMNPMTKKGELISGDKMLALFAQNVLQNNPNATIVCDIKSSEALFDTLKSLGATIHIAPSGHSLIKQAMIDQKAILAGELSCHFFFADRYFGYDDGIYAALRTFEILYQNPGKTLDDLLQKIPHKMSSPEIRLFCSSDADKVKIVEHAKSFFLAQKDLELITIDGVRVRMDYGWGLIRASNTQPVISLRFESDTLAGLLRIKNDFYELLSPHFNLQMLKEKIEL